MSGDGRLLRGLAGPARVRPPSPRRTECGPRARPACLARL